MPPRTARDWSAHFLDFAAQSCAQQPLYRALCEAVATDHALLALCQHMPPRQARANLFLAAVHERLLAGVDHPLRAYFPNLGGARAPDAELPGVLRDLVRREEATIVQHLRTRATQTNEAARCAPLRVALDTLAHDGTRFALFEFGTSAGLMLGVDEDCVRVNGAARGPQAPGAAPRLALELSWQGDAPPPARAWSIAARLGVDLAPVLPDDAEAQRWLQACVWPDDGPRFARLRDALAWVARARPPVRASAHGLDDFVRWLPTLPPGVQPVLLTSWVLGYLSDAERTAFHARALSLVREQGVAWICADGSDAHPLPLPARGGVDTAWTLHTRAGGSRLWAWGHAHGHWLAPAEARPPHEA